MQRIQLAHQDWLEHPEIFPLRHPYLHLQLKGGLKITIAYPIKFQSDVHSKNKFLEQIQKQQLFITNQVQVAFQEQFQQQLYI